MNQIYLTITDEDRERLREEADLNDQTAQDSETFLARILLNIVETIDRANEPEGPY